MRQSFFYERNKYLLFVTATLLSTGLIIGCEEFVQIDAPVNELSAPTVFTSDNVAESAMRGIYSNLATSSLVDGGAIGIAVISGLLSDELSSGISTLTPFIDNEIITDNSSIQTNWNNTYSLIYQSNLLLEGLEMSSNISLGMKAQLKGEAKFVRAFCYFYLVNLWGDVPLILTSDYRENRMISRTSKALVYDQIVQDLSDSKELLVDNFAVAIGQRTRVNKWVATAMLAKVFLYMENWERAENEATIIISNSTLYDTVPLNDVFLRNSKEVIFQFYPTRSLPSNTAEGQVFLPTTSASSTPICALKQELIDDFEAGDNRLVNWTAQKTVNGVIVPYAFKYKVRSGYGAIEYVEYSVVMRLGEQYLIRSEARAQQGKLIGPNSAESDLNIIRRRAGLPATTAVSKDELMDAIIRERRLELFTEGHRWLDLVRKELANTLLGSKPGWQPEDILLPIPQREIDINPKLTQNSGYDN